MFKIKSDFSVIGRTKMGVVWGLLSGGGEVIMGGFPQNRLQKKLVPLF